jgi:two-component system, OmpR family, sensor kinase
MAESRAEGRRRSIGDLLGRMPLRTKLLTAVLGLVAIALAVISLVGIGILRNYLLSGVDQTLAAQRDAVVSELSRGFGVNGSPRYALGEAVIWVPNQGAQQDLLAPTSSYGFAPGQTPQQVPGPAIPANAASVSTDPDNAITVGSTSGTARWRIVGIPASVTEANGSVMHGTVIVATDASSVYRTIGGLTLIDLIVSIGVIVLLGAIAAALIRASLRPLLEIEQTAGAIAAGDLSRRVPERDPRTEVGRLGRSLNIMLSHIETAFRARARSEQAALRSQDKMRQFVADASHELRTPLTAIRGFAEYYRQRGGIGSGDNGTGQLKRADMDRIMRRVEQESARMGVLVEDMLLLARLDQQRPLEAKPVDLLTLAADAVHDARVVAPDRSIHLTVSSGAALIVNGDEVRLRQVIGNLMTNALTHTPAGSPIDVLIRSGTLDEAPRRPQADPDAVEAIDDADDSKAPELPATHQPAAVLEVADQGPGLTREQAEHVFERFYRADPARGVGGTGLGLAIVAALVAGHGGATWVRSVPGEGATFCIALPLTPEAAEGPDEDDGAADDGAADDGTADGGDADPGRAAREADWAERS